MQPSVFTCERVTMGATGAHSVDDSVVSDEGRKVWERLERDDVTAQRCSHHGEVADIAAAVEHDAPTQARARFTQPPCKREDVRENTQRKRP